ncbi:MAG: hypothetical protein AAFN74_03690, partial [Myxococcota bacterium]
MNAVRVALNKPWPAAVSALGKIHAQSIAVYVDERCRSTGHVAWAVGGRCNLATRVASGFP